MIHPHPLDRPVWHALTTRQAALAIGSTRARRMAPDYGVFAAAADMSAASLSDIAALLPRDGAVWIVETSEMPAPSGTRITHTADVNQMIAPAISPGTADFDVVVLDDTDALAMLALATLTEPGPFFARTHQLGRFIGVKQSGMLVAMAGERLKLDGFTEVSGVCTHPDHRGRGYAGGLIRAVAQNIVARGETPFLHVYPDNNGAIALYETLGFSMRQRLVVTVLEQARAAHA